jgi:WD40 repeat protein
VMKGQLLTVAHANPPCATTLSLSTGVATNPAQLPTNTGYGCAFSPDGSLLAVAHQNSPNITIYNTSDWSKVANPAQLPPGNGYGCAFSPDGSLLAVAHNSSPYITIYNTSDWSKVANPAQLPTGAANGCAFSPLPPRVIRGEVRDIDNEPVSRVVRAHERETGLLCASTTSDPVDGSYVLKVWEGDVEYDVQFMAEEGEQLNDLFFASVKSGAS